MTFNEARRNFAAEIFYIPPGDHNGPKMVLLRPTVCIIAKIVIAPARNEFPLKGNALNRHKLLNMFSKNIRFQGIELMTFRMLTPKLSRFKIKNNADFPNTLVSRLLQIFF